MALSILYTAVENLISASVARRVALAFGFGLFHGFGFAFALGESLAFAGDHLPLALFSFNLGVEVGQAGVVLAVIPLLHLIGGTDRSRFAGERAAVGGGRGTPPGTCWKRGGRSSPAPGRFREAPRRRGPGCSGPSRSRAPPVGSW